tara:strand:+ start:267 stop:581 length:315 start_codon:yes stop_codon:yes gene_type:complete
MNRCHFLGKILEKPSLEAVNNTHVTRFFLEVEEFRKDRDGSRKKRKDDLEFEAWDTAATAIQKQAEKNDFMVVECVARRGYNHTMFRVTSFKIFKNQANIDYEK